MPGERDVLNDNGKQYLGRYGKGTQGEGWHSFDQKGVHFIGLVNVLNLKAGGLGTLGQEQLEWLEKDVKGLKSSTPMPFRPRDRSGVVRALYRAGSRHQHCSPAAALPELEALDAR